MQLKDLKINNDGIFSYINRCLEIEFLGEKEIKTLDKLLIAKHGDRKLSSFVENTIGTELTDENMELLGSLLAVEFYDRWDNYFKTLDLLITHNDVDFTVVETIRDNTDRNNNSETVTNNDSVDSTSAFNTSEFIEVDGKENTVKSNTKGDNIEKYERQREVSTKGYRVNNANKVFSTLNNITLCDIMITDVVRVITLLIYE